MHKILSILEAKEQTTTSSCGHLFSNHLICMMRPRLFPWQTNKCLIFIAKSYRHSKVLLAESCNEGY